jgi:TonB family protein
MRPWRALSFIITLGMLAVPATSFHANAQDQPQSDTKRKVVSRVVPVYPELASKMQITGTVRVQAVVGPNGHVKSTQVVGGSPVLMKAAVDAVEKWRWVPAAQDSNELIELNFHP